MVFMKRLLLVLPVAVVIAMPASSSAATCSSHPDQASAQRAKDTRDADGDGIYCESLPCPCLTPGQGGEPTPKATPKPKVRRRGPVGCTIPKKVTNISFSATKYPNIHDHFLDALRAGWPRNLVVNREGASARRNRLLQNFLPRDGFDRDEYPPAVGRGRGKGLQQGSNPRGWQASVRHVPSSENRSHGATMGVKLRRLCNGARFRYVFY